MDNRNGNRNGDYHKNTLLKRFLVQLLVFMMIFGMMPGQSMMAYALPDDTAAATESAGLQEGQSDVTDTQGSGGQEEQQDDAVTPDPDTGGDKAAAGGETPAVQPQGQTNGNTTDSRQKAAEETPAAEENTQPQGGLLGASDSPAAEQAEKNYGENGSAKTFKVTLTDDKDEAYAGDQISYNVDVSMWAAATYPYDGQNQEVMFDKWENITILLDLPDNVVITGIKQNNIGTYRLVDEATNTWAIDLSKTSRDATNSNSIIFDVNTLITGNGALADGTVLDKAEVTVSADFNVRIDEEGNTKKYSKTVTDDTETIQLGTPDSWVLAKSPYESPKNYTINADGTVTIHYLIEYGLNVNDVPVKDPNVYTRTGRVPFAKELKLTDVPELTLHNGDKITADSITVTPAKTGYVYKDGRSADKDGQPEAITVTGGTPVDLPYAVVGTNTKNVDVNAPAYSEYKVDMTYDYDKFMVWFYENADKTEADSKNTATIKYQLLGQTDEKETNDDGETTIPGYIEPGEIEIDKYIVNYDNAQKKLYSKANGYTSSSIISGPATYEIFESDGTTPAKIYYKSLGKYHEHSSNTLTIDPAEAESFTNGIDGKISFYVKAGTYVIKETSAPANTKIAKEDGDAKTITVNEKGKAIAIFDNKEQLGEINVHKQDESENPVDGAVIGLYEDEAHRVPVKDESGNALTKTTDNSGNATFTRLVPGTYYLYEISAPDGYIKSEEVKTVQVTAGNTTDAPIKIVNESNRKVIRLQKNYSTVSNPISPLPVTSDYAKFKNAFTLQQTIDGDVWTDKGTYSIDDKGTTSVQVDELSPDGYKYRYRFVETIPAGYFDRDGNPGDGNHKAYSSVITPADGDALIEMLNIKGGSIELTKNKVSVNASTGAYEPLKQSGKTFKLYRVAEGSNAAEEVAEATTDSNGKITYSNLVSVNSSNKIYKYYVVEQETEEGYEWITDSEITIGGKRTPALEIGSFTTQSGNVLTKTTYNIQQDIVIGIIKKDKLRGTQLKGAKFEVSGGGTTKEITSDTKKATLEIKLGENYTIKETSVPAGYYLDAAQQSINTTGWKVGRKADGSYAVFKADGTEVTADDLTFTFEDTPYQQIRLTKKVKDLKKPDADPVNLNGVTFSVYVKEGNNFVPYKVNGTAVTIKADHSQTVVLPEGDYYLHEDTKLNSVVYPDDHPEKYTGKGEVADGKFYFGKYTVNKPSTKGDILWDVDVINISNTGDLKVNKVLYDKNNVPAKSHGGFRMQLFTLGEDGTTLTPVKVGNKNLTAVTKDNGDAVFNDLPVYDSKGQLINYVVKEVYTGEQADLYYTDDFTSDKSPQTLSLDSPEPVDAGKVINHQYMSVDVVKKYYDAREYELTGLKYELEGATIALYRNNGDGTYTYIGTEQTDKKGQAAFGKLEYSADGFVAIEVSVPDRPEFKYMVPVEGDYLKPEAGGKLPETLTEDQVKKLSRAALVSTTDPQYTSLIENVIPWTQIHVTKWDDNKTKKLDGANFTLYKQVLDEGTTGGELTFDAANCTVVGEYTSGTWIHNDTAQEGEFQTDVLENADNIVYWLVETKAPTGYQIIPTENYVLFTAEGTTYTNKTSGKVYTQESGEVGLKKNAINYHDVIDHKLTGPGEGTENWAYIEFTKWMQKESTAGKSTLERTDFTLMPNATFELYAVNASDHNKVILLDTITTGDENDVEPSSVTTGYGVSRSLDAWAIFDEIEKKYPDQLDDIITYKSAEDSGYDVTYPYVVGPDGKPVEDAQGNRKRIKGTFTLNAVLIEKNASSKYALDLHDHNLQITFVPSDLSLGNSKYAVIDITDTNAALCDENEARRSSYTENISASMAIVDYLSTDNSVVLRHFGYDPELVGYEMMHADLEAKHEDNPGLFVSKKVTYKLEKYNAATKAWEAWSPTENKKLPSGTGTFETDGNGYHFDKGLDPGDYRVIMTIPAAGYENFYPDANTAFKFTVVTTGRTQVFTTYSPEKPDVTIEKVDLNGRTVSAAATFSLKSKSGTSYSQTASTSDGKAVFKDLPADTTFTLSETAAPSGYTNAYFAKLFSKQYPDYAKLVDGSGYALSYTTKVENGEKYIVKKEYKDAFSLKVPNTETVKLKLIKKDAQDAEKFLSGAQFKIYYLAFDRVSGSYTVPAYVADGSWTDLGTVTAGTDGTITKSDLKPGVYYVIETKAPDHYDLDPEGKTIVMTGGLDLTIAKSDKYMVNTVSGGTGELEFKDMPKVKMTVNKKVELGSLDPRDYSFTFSLLDSEGKTIAGDPAKASKTGATVTSAVFKDLSQGKKYYLKEAPAAGYHQIDTVMVGNNAVSPQTTGKFKGYYEIEIPTDGSNVTVTVSNILLEAKVRIFKYDGEDGSGLTGASFEVLKSDKKTVVSKASITDNGDGSYTAVIPLEGTAPADFYIRETKAPDNYTIDENNKDILVRDLKPGDAKRFKFNGTEATDNELVLPNFEGIDVTVLKYGGLPDNTGVDPLAGAQFQMYFSTDGGNSWSSWHPAETTGSDGKATFQILKGYDYAVAETNKIKGFVGLYGIYKGTTKLETATSTDGRTLYILGHDFVNGQSYEFKAYNIPYLKLIVEKEDISGTVEDPNVEFHVYEVPNDTPTTLTDEQISDLAAASKVFIENKTKNSTYTNEEFIRPGKTYLAVEDRAIDTKSEFDDYSIIKDDSRVVTYEVFSVPETNYKEEYTVTFVNNKGDATIGLEKTVDKEKVDSLTVKDAELTYTLKPESTNGYALDAYKLTDSGLTPDPSNATLADEWYNITEVIVGQGKMDNYLRGAKTSKDYQIFATVTFVGFDGTEYEQTPVNVSQGNITVVPTGTSGKNIKSFYVEYSSPDLLTDTGYALGQNFSAGETVVKATVFKQEKPDQGVITSVKKIRNDAEVELTYTPWSSKGVKEQPVTIDDDDFAETTVDGAKAPEIAFHKDGPDRDTAVELGSDLTYKLTVTNISEEELYFTDPIIVDLLPRGMVVDQDSEFVKVTSKPDTIAANPVVTTGYAGESQYVNIAFTGTVAKGESIEVELTAKVTTAVTNYGNTMRNFAFTTSKEVGVATSDNVTGAVIKDDKGLWAGELVSIATALTCDRERAEALKTALGKQGTYGYLVDWHENFWVTDNELVCVKSEYGPSDGGVYRTDKVAVLVNDEKEVSQRTMHYRLTINNESASKRTNLAVMDILPVVGDNRINNTPRGSNWDLYFDKMGAVTVNGESCDDYTVYFYDGDAKAFDADDITDVITEAKDGCPSGWSTSQPAKPTAFIVAFNYDKTDATEVSDGKTVVLEGMKTVQIEYTAVTDYREAEPLAEIVFTNAANDFNFGFSTFAPPTTADKARPNEPLGSNVVEVTIAPPKVKVGGDVWIDADDNGKQDDGDQSWYLGFDIVKQLIKDLDVDLSTSNLRNFGVVEETAGTINETGSDAKNYGIAHFEFDDLTSAKLRNGSTDYLNWNDGSAAKLIGKNPYTYHMNMSYKGNTFLKTINTIDPRGSWIPGQIPDADQKDDNFNTLLGGYRTEQFFLHQTADPNWDMTKDIGFNLHRNLELTKVSRADGAPVEGAQFTIYGPFEHDTGAKQELDDAHKVATVTTDGDGIAAVDDLFFFKEYVIVETKAAKGFGIEGSSAEGTNIRKLDEGKWLLSVPDTTSKSLEDKVIVRDPENIDVEVEKFWDDQEDMYGTRPGSIKVMLYTDEACTVEAKDADGNVVESKTLSDANNWKEKWTDLPRYKVEKSLLGGEKETEIQYYVKETDSEGEDMKGYEVVITYDKDETTGDQSLKITNTPISTGLEVRKTWEDTDDLAAAVTAVTFRVEQSADGETWTPAKAHGEEILLTIERKQGEKMGTAEIEGLPAYDADDNPLTYRAVEISITANGEVIEVKDGKVGSYEVTEKHTPGRDASPEKATATDLSEISNIMIPTEFTVEKSFVEDDFNLNKDIRSINVMLQRKSGSSDWTNAPEGSVDLRSIRGWKHTWKGLPKYDPAGNAYMYRAVEVSYTTKSGETVEVLYDNTAQTSGSVGAYRYTSRTEGDADSGYTTYIENKPVKGSLKVNKQWKDAGKATVPESITVKLSAFADGKEIRLSGVTRSVTLSKANNWSDSTTWANLPVYTADGVQISYQLTESGKGKYTAEYKINYGDGVVGEGSGTTLDVKLISNRVVDATFINKLEPPVKTGDNTPLVGYLALLLTSALCIVLICIRRRQKN